MYIQACKNADVARGKLALVYGLMVAMLTDMDGIRERLQRSLLCCSCRPLSGRVTANIFEARIILTDYSGLSPL